MTRAVLPVVVLLMATLVGATPAKAAPAQSAPTPGSQPSASSQAAGRPAGVPTNYLPTPYGYVHPACLLHLGADQVGLVRNGQQVVVDLPPVLARRAQRIRAAAEQGHATGSVEQLVTSTMAARGRRLGTCRHDRYDARGRRITSASTTSAARQQAAQASGATPAAAPYTGWIQSADQPWKSVSYLKATWNVPASPSLQTDQTIFYFPGAQAMVDDGTIVQPVLGWNAEGNGTKRWSIASWNCCRAGYVQHSDFIPLTTNLVQGKILGTNCDWHTGVCQNWLVSTWEVATGRRTSLDTTAYGAQMNWVFGGALEVYNLASCRQLPGTTVTFSDLTLRDTYGHAYTPSWSTTQFATGFAPDCGYSVSASPSSVTVAHDPTLATP